MKWSIILIVIFILFSVTEANAQDTVCYKEIERYNQCSLRLSYEYVASYKYNWLLSLEKNFEDKTSTLSIYKKYDTIQTVLSKEYFYWSLGTTIDGVPFMIEHNNKGYDVKTILIFDSLLKETAKYIIKNNSFNNEQEDELDFNTYQSMTYLKLIDGDIILRTAPYLNFKVYGRAFKVSLLELELKEFNRHDSLYDFGRDRTIKEEQNLLDIHDGRRYKYNIKQEVYGNISPSLINNPLLFIDNGFVVQMDNGDIVFYKFCD